METSQSSEFDDLDLDPDDPRPWRKHARTLEKELKAKEQQLQQFQEQALSYQRKEAFEKAKVEAGVEVDFDTVAALPPEQITPTFLKAKAEEQAQSQEQALATLAKAAGFEDVNLFKQSLEAAKAQVQLQQQEQSSLAATAGAASGGAPVPKRTPQEQAWIDYQQSLASGRPRDMAEADYVRTLREMTVDMKTAPSVGGATG